MNLEKLKPWNWFKHEDPQKQSQSQVPLTRNEAESLPTRLGGGHGSLMRLHSELDRLFDDVFNAFGIPPLRSTNGRGDTLPNGFVPQVDVSGDEKKYEITLDVPGLSESDISINVSGDILTISGQKEEKAESKDKHFYRIERSYGSFQRTLSLPDDVQANEIQASLKNGVLRLEIPRREGVKKDSKTIPISSS